MSAILLIRHGQASFGAADYDQLSPLGEEQSRILGAALRARGTPVHRAYHGGMKRHRQTAEHGMAALGSTQAVQELPGFREYDHEQVVRQYLAASGSSTALKASDSREARRAFQTLFTEAMRRWMGGAHDADYRESWPAFRQRVLAALEDVACALEGGQTALVFTSGGPVMAAAQSLLGLGDAQALQLNWVIANASVSKVVVGRGGRHLSTLNEHSHLEHEARLVTYR